MSEIKSELYPTDADTSVLDYDTNSSVKKYQYDLNDSSELYAQVIKDDYFVLEEYNHSITVYYDIKTYTWNYTESTVSVADLKMYNDISDKVISVDFMCDATSDIKTSVSLSLLVPPDDDFWYMNRIYDIRENRTFGQQGNNNTMWIPQIYCVNQIIVDGDNTITRRLGFYLPDNSSYSYDSVTSTFNIQLQNLTYQFTPEGGGVIVTALRSYDYYIDMPYNHNPTKIIAYKTQETVTVGQQSAGEKPDTKTEEEEDKDYLLSLERSALDSIPKDANKYGTAEVLFESETSEFVRTINTPLPLSISGYDNGQLMLWDGMLMTSLIYQIAMSRMDVIMNNYRLPLVGWHSPFQDSEYTSKSDIFPLGWDFDNGTDVMNIAKTMLSDRYYDYMIWVDEDRNLCINTIPTYPNTWRSCIYYRDYGELVISEDISINDNDFYTVVEVYGKNNEYYGVCDGTQGGFKIIVNPDTDADWYNTLISHVSVVPKTKSIFNDSIESDLDCFYLASYELWKSFSNSVSISIKVRDNNIGKFDRMSHVVGEQFFEYRLNQGKGKTIKCILTKATLNDGVWSLELKPFQSYAPSYDWYDVRVYYQFKTKFYDQFLAAKWNQDKISWNEGSNSYITQKEKHTLSQPVILAYQIIKGDELEHAVLRLYITGIDIGLSLVKVWRQNGNGAFNSGEFLGESSDTDGTDTLPWGTPHAETISDLEDGEHIYKIFDYPITQNGTYSFNCQLYNVFYESSVGSNSVIITLQTDDTNKIYLTNELGQKLTTENDERLTI